jgi:hypothetical protein
LEKSISATCDIVYLNSSGSDGNAKSKRLLVLFNTTGYVEDSITSRGQLSGHKLVDGSVEDIKIRSLTADKITAGTIAALISIIGPLITGGTIRTAESGERIELTGNKLTTYNAAGQMHGPRIYPGDGDIVFCRNGIPVLSVGLAGSDGVSIQPLSGYPLIIEGYPTYDWVIDHTARNSDTSFGVFGVGPAAQQTAALLPEDGSSTIHDLEVKINGMLNKLANYGLFSVT